MRRHLRQLSTTIPRAWYGSAVVYSCCCFLNYYPFAAGSMLTKRWRNQKQLLVALCWKNRTIRGAGVGKTVLIVELINTSLGEENKILLSRLGESPTKYCNILDHSWVLLLSLALALSMLRHLRQLSTKLPTLPRSRPVVVNSYCCFLNYYPFAAGSMLTRRWRSQKQPDIESTIVRSVEERLSTLPDQPVAATIFKVPHTITRGQPEAYKPNFVSIGPFHHNGNFPDGHQTKAAEAHKIWYLRDFLERAGQPCEFKDYVSGILLLERKARNCYSEEVQLSSQELVEGMVLDACFIIELFLKDKECNPIYGTLRIEHIAYDLLLLENQLPFFILEDVYKRFNKEKSSFKPLTELAMNLFNKLVRRKDAKLPEQSVEVHHLLHLVYLHFVIDQPLSTSKLNFLCECICFPFQQRSRSSNEAQLPTDRVLIPSATQLHDAGVKFSKGKNTNFLAIEIKNGRLEIPPFFLDDSSGFFLRNLIAFEQCFAQTNRKYLFTMYARFMDRLVSTDKDIEILSKIGIIEHVLGSDEEAAGFFNKLGNGLVVNFENTHLGETCEQLNKYYRFRPHRVRAKLMHDYFRYPWSILSPVAALVLLSCTVIQTLKS